MVASLVVGDMCVTIFGIRGLVLRDRVVWDGAGAGVILAVVIAGVLVVEGFAVTNLVVETNCLVEGVVITNLVEGSGITDFVVEDLGFTNLVEGFVVNRLVEGSGITNLVVEGL